MRESSLEYPPFDQKSWQRCVGDWDRVGAIVILSLISYVLFSFLFHYRPSDLAPWRVVATATILISFLFIMLYFNTLKRRWKSEMTGAWTLLLILGALSNASGWTGRVIFDELLMYLLALLAAGQLSLRGALLFTAGLFGAWLLMICMVHALTFETAMLNAFGFLPGMVLLFGFGRVARILVRKRQEVEQQKQRASKLLMRAREKRTALEAAQKNEHRLVAAQERIEAAEQIHGDLGGAIETLKSQLLRTKERLEKDHPSVLENIQICRSLTKAALQRVRRSVARLRKKPVDFEDVHSR